MTRVRLYSFSVVLAVLAACSGGAAPSDGNTGGTQASGGASTGGAGGTGGSASSGGTVATGGAGTGGATSSGGVIAAGGGGAGAAGSAEDAGARDAEGADSAVDARAGNPSRDAQGLDTARDSQGADTARDGQSVDAGRDSQGADSARDAQGADTAVNTSTAVTVYVAGDSTVSTYTNSSIKQGGWGQFLQTYFIANAKVVNKAVGGMTARHYIEAGYLDQILAVIKAGDYLLVQFGTNDSNKTATYTLNGKTIPYYLDAATDYKTYLTKYVDATKAKGATTIFVTPPPRHSCSGTALGVANGLGAYATAMKELAPTINTKVVDLNAMTVAYLSTIACDVSGKTFYLVKADGTIDSTHFQENGANIMAGLVAKGTSGIASLGLPLSAYVK